MSNLENHFCGSGMNTNDGNLVKISKTWNLYPIAANFQNIQTGSGVGTNTNVNWYIFNGSYFFRGAHTANFHRSTDGLTWTNFATPPVAFSDMYCRQDTGTLIGQHPTASTTNLYRSDDHGATWNVTGALPLSANWLAAYGNGVWIAIPKVAASGSVNCAISYDDGLTWVTGGVLTYPGSGLSWISIAFGNGVFIASCAYDMYVIMSTDGMKWGLQYYGIGSGTNGKIRFDSYTGLFTLDDPNNSGRFVAGTGGAWFYLPMFYQGSTLSNVHGWIFNGVIPNVLYSSKYSRAIYTNDAFRPNMYGNGYYVFVRNAGESIRATEPVLTYLTRTE